MVLWIMPFFFFFLSACSACAFPLGIKLPAFSGIKINTPPIVRKIMSFSTHGKHAVVFLSAFVSLSSPFTSFPHFAFHSAATPLLLFAYKARMFNPLLSAVFSIQKRRQSKHRRLFRNTLNAFIFPSALPDILWTTPSNAPKTIDNTV